MQQTTNLQSTIKDQQSHTHPLPAGGSDFFARPKLTERLRALLHHAAATMLNDTTADLNQKSTALQKTINRGFMKRCDR
jgi:hypothetical protein